MCCFLQGTRKQKKQCNEGNITLFKACNFHILQPQMTHTLQMIGLPMMMRDKRYLPTENTTSNRYQVYCRHLWQVLYAQLWSPEKKWVQSICTAVSRTSGKKHIPTLPFHISCQNSQQWCFLTWISCWAVWTCAEVPLISTEISSGKPLLSWTVRVAPLVRRIYAMFAPPTPMMSSA